MKHRIWLHSSSMLALAMASIVGVAQETDKKETDSPAKRNEVSLGVSSFAGLGDFGRYARPASGFTLNRLALFAQGSKSAPYGRLMLKGIGDQDNLVDGVLWFNQGKTALRASRSQFGPTVFAWPGLPHGADDMSDVTLSHSLAPNSAAFLNFHQTKRSAYYPPPRAADQVETRAATTGASGRAFGGNGSVSMGERHTYHAASTQPETLQRNLAASFGMDVAPSLNLEGTARFARVEQAGFATTSSKAFGLNGDWSLGDRTSLQFRLSRQDLDMKAVANPRLQKKVSSGLRLVHRERGWSAQLGFTHGETERVRTDRSFVDVPKTDVWEGRLNGRLGAGQLTLKGSYERLTDLPVMNTEDPRSLQWDKKASFQARFSLVEGDTSSYGNYTYTTRQNSDRGVDLGWQCLSLGVSRSFGSSFFGFLEVQAEDYRLGGWADGGQALDPYFPNARSLALGCNWVKDATLDAALSLNHSESSDLRDTQLTFSLRKRFSADRDIELVVSPWRRDDRLNDLTGYRATFLMVRSTMRF